MMDEYMEKALDIVKAQAAVRPMTEEEILAQIRRLSSLLRGMKQKEETPPVPKKTRRSIREQSILCLECGRRFRMLTIRHLATHGLTPDEYRKKWGLEEDTPLLCRALQKTRRSHMHSMRLWERRSTTGKRSPQNPQRTAGERTIPLRGSGRAGNAAGADGLPREKPAVGSPSALGRKEAR